MNKKELSEIIVKLYEGYINGNGNENRLMKCLSYFMYEKEIIITSGCLFGVKNLFKILNYQIKLISKENDNLLLDYLKNKELTNEEEKEIVEIITDENILIIFIKKLTTFSYPQSKYTFYKGNNVMIKPTFDGTKCKFSINSDLPKDIIFNKQNGEISGKINDEIKECEYTIKCKNIWKEIEVKLKIEIKEIYFDEENKGEYIELEDNKRKIKCIIENDRCLHNVINYNCYLNCKIKKNEYFSIKFKYDEKNCNGSIRIGLSSDERIGNNYFYCKIEKNDTVVFNSGNIDGNIVSENPNIKLNNGSIYEMICDMKERELSIKMDNSNPIVLVNKLQSDLIPFLGVGYKNNSLELL